MLQLCLKNVGKRYGRNWIFRNIEKDLILGDSYAILGSNGVGKSTFLQLLSGNISPTEGDIKLLINGKELEAEQAYQHVSFAAPYLDLISEFTLLEQIAFHYSFKKLPEELTLKELPTLMDLEKEKDKQLNQFSSGMMQRVKLALAILSNCPILLLDEPISNLDSKGIHWYQELLTRYGSSKLVAICSNNRVEEYQFCKQEIIIENYR